jgi:hypothetical protein
MSIAIVITTLILLAVLMIALWRKENKEYNEMQGRWNHKLGMATRLCWYINALDGVMIPIGLCLLVLGIIFGVLLSNVWFFAPVIIIILVLVISNVVQAILRAF